MGAEPAIGHSIRNCYIAVTEYPFPEPPAEPEWVDITGAANMITPTGGDRATGEAYSFQADSAGVTVGKRASRSLTIRILYHETPWDEEEEETIHEIIRELFEAGEPIILQYAPLGNAAGNKMYTTDPYAYISALGEPGGDASSGDPIMLEFTVIYSEVSEATIAGGGS